ncbi:MAG: DNA methylase [Nitrospirae bacterium]|nr:DNA methylase [Nitrospirota bacterium]
MAESLAHTFGQIIGNVLEEAVEPALRKFAGDHGLLLDKKGHRNARKGKKVTWTDIYGNSHDLDFVLERGGTEKTIGTPVAFIETAWRRYTKHSRNKAQEIQGAIQALALTHKYSHPFIGTILAGVFTDGALTQLKSLGFHVLYFPYKSILTAFKSVGVDADFNENTPEKEFRRKLRQWKSISKKIKRSIAKCLIDLHKADIQAFFDALEKSIARKIAKITIIPLHGRESEHRTVETAIEFLTSYKATNMEAGVYKFEIYIRYSNGDRITAEFTDKNAAVEFLNKYM